MAKWILEPGHTAAEFSVRHMMVTDVRGHFKNIQGSLEFEPGDPRHCSVEARIDARGIWTGDAERDAHLRSADFLDVEKYPTIIFSGNEIDLLGDHDCLLWGDLTIRGVTRRIPLEVRYLGQWKTPWWEGGVDRGPKVRAGFLARTRIKRHDFGVSWNSALEKGGIVVGNDVDITIDAEAIRET